MPDIPKQLGPFADLAPEASIRSFMERLQDYLEYLISLGSMTTGEASSIVQEQWGLLYPTYDKEGKKLRDEASIYGESDIHFTKLPFYSKVQAWGKQQGEAYLRSKAQEESQIKSDLEQREKEIKVQQRSQTMGETGAANWANQQRLKWEGKQQEINEARRAGGLRGMTRSLQEQGQGPIVDRTPEPKGGLPSTADVFYPFLEDMSASMKRFYEGKLGEITKKKRGLLRNIRYGVIVKWCLICLPCFLLGSILSY